MEYCYHATKGLAMDKAPFTIDQVPYVNAVYIHNGVPKFTSGHDEDLSISFTEPSSALGIQTCLENIVIWQEALQYFQRKGDTM